MTSERLSNSERTIANIPKSTSTDIDDRSTRRKTKYDHSFRPRNARERHEQFVQTVYRYGDNKERMESMHSRRGKNDFDILRDHYRLNRADANDRNSDDEENGKRLAVQYERELNKEYGIVNLKGYKKGKCGIRWRTKDEVLMGKGYRICGGSTCEVKMDRRRRESKDTETVLTTFMVPFVHLEDEQYKHTDIKLRLCSECGQKLNYKAAKKERKRERKRRKKERRRRRGHGKMSTDSAQDQSGKESD